MGKNKGMTEAEWLACTDPMLMLGIWSPIPRRRLTNRKLTLFACACCHRIRRILPDESCRQAVDIAERFANGLADSEELHEARLGIEAMWPEPDWQDGSSMAAYAAYFSTFDGRAADDFQEVHGYTGRSNYNDLLVFFKDTAASCAADAHARKRATSVRARSRRYNAERAAQADILRDTVGNPVRPVVINRRLIWPWLTWQDGMIPKIAQAIYDQRAFDRLPILADALEEAGCTDPEILSHLRGPGPHVRGCWLLDLLLNKE